MNIWRKFIECACGGEGIMISYETKEDGIPVIDLAFFGHGYITNRTLTLWEKLRYCWYILIKGQPFADEIILSQENAYELTKELMKFVRIPYKKIEDKRNKQPSARAKPECISLGGDENEKDKRKIK